MAIDDINVNQPEDEGGINHNYVFRGNNKKRDLIDTMLYILELLLSGILLTFYVSIPGLFIHQFNMNNQTSNIFWLTLYSISILLYLIKHQCAHTYMLLLLIFNSSYIIVSNIYVCIVTFLLSTCFVYTVHKVNAFKDVLKGDIREFLNKINQNFN